MLNLICIGIQILPLAAKRLPPAVLLLLFPYREISAAGNHNAGAGCLVAVVIVVVDRQFPAVTLRHALCLFQKVRSFFRDPLYYVIHLVNIVPVLRCRAPFLVFAERVDVLRRPRCLFID